MAGNFFKHRIFYALKIFNSKESAHSHARHHRHCSKRHIERGEIDLFGNFSFQTGYLEMRVLNRAISAI